MRKSMTARSCLLLRLALGVLMMTLSACAHTPTRSQVGSMDDVIAHVHDPAMKQVWMDARAQRTLPPADKIPMAENPVSRRQVAQVKAAPARPLRPVIPKESVIAVQPFSEQPVSDYDGRFEVVSHEAGVLKGRLHDRESLLEIFYKLPGTTIARLVERPATFHLRYRDEVLGNALQRRIILFDPETKRAPLIAIAEGSPKPYRAVIKELGLVIEQTTQGNNPAVTLRYGEEAATLQEGETTTIGQGTQQLTVYLLNSYVQDPRYADADPGQPYYVSIILYQ
jgi:hypothetical protein